MIGYTNLITNSWKALENYSTEAKVNSITGIFKQAVIFDTNKKNSSGYWPCF